MRHPGIDSQTELVFYSDGGHPSAGVGEERAMARAMLTDVLEREAIEDALDPLPEDDLPVVDVQARDGYRRRGTPAEFDGDAYADADGEPLPDDVQAEIEALVAEGVDGVDVEPDVEPDVDPDAGPDEMDEMDEMDGDLAGAADDADGEDEPAAASVEAEPELAAALTAALAAARAELERQRGLAAGAVARYREAMLAADPDLPPDLVAGASIEEVDASIEAARAMVARVRERVEARRPQGRGFPAGAPAREPGGLTHLTARQKIAAGLQERLI